VSATLADASVVPSSPPQTEAVKSPIVMVVGCAAPSAEPQIWVLSHAGPRTASDAPGISTADTRDLKTRPAGRDTYHLIGVADFVTAEESRRIGVRGKIFSPSRVNATGTLLGGHKVAVKGLFIDARPPRINLTSVVDLGATCP
jgi:hypothetical protein